MAEDAPGRRRSNARSPGGRRLAVLVLSILVPLCFPFAGAVASPRGGAGAVPDSPHGEPEGGFGWSLQIHAIQRGLQETGDYEGPVTGRITPETTAAIEAYQSRQDLRVDGKPSDFLLQHLSTLGAQQAIRGRLAQARREQMAAATKALESTTETRDLVAATPVERADPRRDPQRCFKELAVACFLEEASETIKTLPRDVYRDWALRDLVIAEATAGRADAARHSIRRLDDPRLKLSALRDMAAALAVGGNLGDARATAAIIPDAVNRAQAYAALAAAEARSDYGMPEEAVSYLLETAMQIDEPLKAIEILGEAAVQLGRADASLVAGVVAERALAIARELPEGSDRSAGMTHAINALLGAGRADAALQVLSANAGESRLVPAAEVKSAEQAGVRDAVAPGLLDAADTAQPDLRPLALAKVAHLHAALGDRDGAREILQRAVASVADIERPAAVDAANARIATVLAVTGEHDAAADRLQDVNDQRLRARTLWQIAEESRVPGDVEAGRLWLERALAATHAVDSPFDRAAILCDAAVAAAYRADGATAAEAFAAALSAASVIDSGWWRARILSRIAIALHELDGADVPVAR